MTIHSLNYHQTKKLFLITYTENNIVSWRYHLVTIEFSQVNILLILLVQFK